MAPEQLTHFRTGFASDVFAFGIVAYELLSGRHPFAGEDGSVYPHAIISLRHAPVQSVVPGLPGSLASCIERCLEKDPERRFRSLIEVHREFARAAFPLKRAEAKRLATDGLARFREGNQGVAEELAERAERLDRACPELMELHELLREASTPTADNGPVYAALFQKAESLAASARAEDRAAARVVVAALIEQFGDSPALRTLQGRLAPSGDPPQDRPPSADDKGTGKESGIAPDQGREDARKTLILAVSIFVAIFVSLISYRFGPSYWEEHPPVPYSACQVDAPYGPSSFFITADVVPRWFRFVNDSRSLYWSRETSELFASCFVPPPFAWRYNPWYGRVQVYYDERGWTDLH